MLRHGRRLGLAAAAGAAAASVASLSAAHDGGSQPRAAAAAGLLTPAVISTTSVAPSPMAARMEGFIRELQAEICAAVEEMDGGGRFEADEWLRKAEGGGGVSRVLQNGATFEKAGVNISVVHGQLPVAAVKQMRSRNVALPEGDSIPFFATGLSLVIHPHSPMVPTVHLNYRYFEVPSAVEGEAPVAWFGGGCDLTPSYLYEEDAAHFHNTLKAACDKHDAEHYPRFKAWCDKYFWLPHRSEARGVGGIFFDDLDDANREKTFAFVRECANAFLPSYAPIVARRRDAPYAEKHKRWQQLRRGRYVEFNLVHDRGTKFGLNTPGARIESILMSLPLTARWEYMAQPEGCGCAEKRLQGVLEAPRYWAGWTKEAEQAEQVEGAEQIERAKEAKE